MAIVDQIIGVESGGRPDATNDRSSASGLGQFIDSTWLATVRAHRPDLAGQPDEQLLALKTDPQLSKDMTAAYAADNQAILSKNGLPVTPGTTYLAHFAGPGGAVKVLQADPSTPIDRVLSPDAIKANPFLRGMTAQGLQDWAAKKMGAAAPPAAAAPQSMPAAGSTIPQPSAPIFASQMPAPAPSAAPQAFGDQPMQAAPIFAPARRQIDLSGLRAALARAPIFSNRG